MPPIQKAPATSSVGEQRDVRVSPELEAELLEAMGEIDRGDYFELTPEQLDRAAATGEWPWPDDESLG
jgi:hypothetical protein